MIANPNAIAGKQYIDKAVNDLRNKGVEVITTDEGGVIPEEFRVEYVVDRVKTTGNVWMGLTMECAQCHDHKYDPISQEEYYQFYAFYNNNADPGMQTRNGNTGPMLEIYPDHAKRRSELDIKIKTEAKIIVENLKIRDKWKIRREIGKVAANR